MFLKSIGITSLAYTTHLSYKSYCSSPSSPSSSILRGYCELAPNGKPCNHTKNSHNKEEKEDNQVKGYVRFEDDGKICRIFYYITGLHPGLHGFHM